MYSEDMALTDWFSARVVVEEDDRKYGSALSLAFQTPLLGSCDRKCVCLSVLEANDLIFTGNAFVGSEFGRMQEQNHGAKK